MMTIVSIVLAAGLLMLSSPSASAQTAAAESSSSQWAHWAGCWQVVEESVQDGAALLATPTLDEASPPRRPAAATVCVTSPGDHAATLTTLVDGQPVIVETLVADARPKPLTDPGCRGWQRAEWSAVAPRVYTRAEIACGTQPQRIVSGLSMITAGPRWLDVQVIESEGRTSMRVRRYRPVAAENRSVTPEPLSAVRSAASQALGRSLSIADIREAASRVPPEALQAAVMELGAGGYDLNAKRLRELDAAGVPDSVIDLMVALSFPKKFEVERASYGGGGFGSFNGGSDLFDDMLWRGGGRFDDLWAYNANPYLYSSLYAPFAYRHWGYSDSSYFQGPGYIVVNPGNTGGAVSPIESSDEGRVIDGRGYTRIRRVEPTPAVTNAGNGVASGTSAGADRPSSGSSGSSSGVSSSGYSGGASSGSSGRTAQPRPPGQ